MSKRLFKILIIEDSAADRAVFRHYLNRSDESDFAFFEAELGAAGIEICAREHPDCVLLNYQLLDADGLEILRKINSDARNPEFPVVLITDTKNELLAVNAIEAGAQDYLVKGKFSPEELQLTVYNAIEFVRLRRRQKEAEDTLNRYRLLAERSRDIILFFRPDAQIIEANRAALDAYGFTREEILEKTLYDIRAPETHAELSEQLRLAEEKGGLQFETVHRRGDGSQFPVEISWTLTEIDGERVILNIIRDITERRQAQEALRASEERLRLAAQASGFGFHDYDVQNNVSVWSPELRELIGIAPGVEITMETVVGQVHPDDRERIKKAMQATFDPQSSGEFAEEFRVVRADTGEVRWFYNRCQTFFTGKGKARRAVRNTGIVVDVTERKEAEEQLRETTAILAAVNDNTSELIFVKDRDCRLIYANPATLSAMGITMNQAMSSDDAARFSVIEEADEINANDHRIMESGAAETIEETYTGANGETRIYLSTKTPLRDTDGAVVGLVGVSRDITERKIAEEKLRRNHETFYNLVKNTPFGIFIVDADFRLVEISEGSQKVFSGIEPLIGRDFAEILRIVWEEPFASEAIEIFRHTFATGEPYHAYNTTEQRGNKEDVESYDWKIERVNLPDGRFGVVCYFYDLTIQKQIQEKLRQSEEVFRLASEAAATLVYDADLTGSRKTVTYGLERVTGYAAEEAELTGEWFHSLIHPEDLPAHLENLARQLKKDKIYRATHRLKRRDGAWVWVEDTGQIIRDENGTAIQLVGALVDITARKEAEEKLRDEQRFTQNIIETAPSLTYIYSLAETKNIFISNQVVEVLGYSIGEIIQMGTEVISNLLHPDDVPIAAARFERIFADREDGNYELEYRMCHKSGKWVWLFDRTRVFRRDFDGQPVELLGVATDITKRKEAEERLRYQLQLTQSITDTAAVAIFVSDLNGKVTFLNPEAEKIFGYTLEEIAGRNLHETIHYRHSDGSPFPAEDCPLGKIFSVGSPVLDYEGTFYRKDGSPVEIICSNTPIIENGAIRGEVMAMLDITTRKRREANLKFLADLQTGFAPLAGIDQITETAGKLISEYLNLSHCLFVEIDEKESNATVFNDYRAEESKNLLGVYIITDFHTEAERRQLAAGKTVAINDVRGGKRPPEAVAAFESLGIGALLNSSYISSGRWTFVLSAQRSEPYEWRADEIELMQELAERIYLRLERARAEERLRSSEEFNRTVLESSPDCVKILDSEGRLQYMNANGMCLMEIDDFAPYQDELWFNLWTAESQPLVKNSIEKAVRGETAEFQAFSPAAKGAPKWWDVRVSPVGATGGKPQRLIAVSRDITEQKRAADALLEAETQMRREAEEANRAKDEFLAMLSHELRSPLNSMYGWTQILQKSEPNAETSRRAIETIARSVRLQNALIEDLLDVSRIISGKMQLEKETVSLVSIVQSAVEAARPNAEKKGLEIIFALALADEVNGDRHRLSQIVGNLLTNAVKFTPSRGKINVELEQVGGMARLVVKDTGIGIEPDVLPHIFDRFRQADTSSKRKFGGLGLGLAIVKHLVELHGGTVTAHSEGAGRGAAFTVEIPLAAPFIEYLDFPNPSASSAAPNDKPLAGVRILMVDDDRDALELMRFALESNGAQTVCVDSANAALQSLSGENFDLLISDLGMAEMDGFDLIEKIRELETGSPERLPAVALTGYVSVEHRERVLRAGFQKHLAKPVDLDNLLTVALGLINGK